MFALIPSCLCIIFCAVALMNLEVPPSGYGANRGASIHQPVLIADTTTKSADKHRASPADTSRFTVWSSPPGNSVATGASETLAVGEADLAYLRTKNLLIPVAGVTAGELRDSFYEVRSEGRIHQALDIKASQGTPVLASADGKVKLYTSNRGGTMIYETDSSGLYVYYYGHLQRYADGMYEGKLVKRGEVIAYVGDTGNAGPGNFHLHFGIAKVSAPGKWSGGEPINPYPLLTAK